jgi:lactate permease
MDLNLPPISSNVWTFSGPHLPVRQRRRLLHQPVTANAIGLNPVLTASVNSAAGVMGKMISLQSIAVAVAATGLTPADEGRLFRFTIKHSILLTIVMGIVAMLYAYVFPNLVPVAPAR